MHSPTIQSTQVENSNAKIVDPPQEPIIKIQNVQEISLILLPCDEDFITEMENDGDIIKYEYIEPLCNDNDNITREGRIGTNESNYQGLIEDTNDGI